MEENKHELKAYGYHFPPGYKVKGFKNSILFKIVNARYLPEFIRDFCFWHLPSE